VRFSKVITLKEIEKSERPGKPFKEVQQSKVPLADAE
jgi:hypothetical protein